MTDELRVGERTGWVLTRNGQKIHYENPDYGQITILDISHHLGNLCRFTGATRFFYSVAQHSMLVTYIIRNMLDNGLSEEERGTAAYFDQLLAGMLHDAAEAYINDVASPLKRIIKGRYGWVENGLTQVIFERYGVDREYMNGIVKSADNLALYHERRHLLPPHADWVIDDDDMIEAEAPEYLPPHVAGALYLKLFTKLLEKRNAARADAKAQDDV